jgi:hypothetical protein
MYAGGVLLSVASVALGSLASVVCLLALAGGGGHASTSTSTESSERRELRAPDPTPGVPRTQSDRAARATALARNAGSIAQEDDEAPPPVESRLPVPFLCSRDPVAFDLSRLSLAPNTPEGFRLAWDAVRSRTDVPGFVIAYSGTMWGPAITARVGAVKPVTNGLYAFEQALVPSDADVLGAGRADPFHVRTDHLNRDFVVAMGKVREREGFSISHITVDGRLDPLCQSLRNVAVDITLPHSNVGQEFGGRTIAEAMGPMTLDTDHDGEPDAWELQLTGDSLPSLMFQL